MKTDAKTQGRIAWIDALKGFSMIAVVLSHSSLGRHIPYFYFVTRCYMATFYFLSGYTYHEKADGFSSYCNKRAKRLLIPYAVYGVALVALDSTVLFLKGSSLKTIIFQKWGGLIYGRYMLCYALDSSTGGLVHFMVSWNSSLWFLTSMFVSSLLFYGLAHLSSKRRLLAILLCFASSAAFIYCPVLLPWSLDTVPLTALIMLSGFYFKKLNLDEMSLVHKISFLIPVAVVYLICVKFGDGINLSIRIYGSRGLVSFAWALSQLFVGSVCFTLFFSMIPPIRLLFPFAFIGRHSITYLCTHFFVLFIAGRLFSCFALPEITSAVLCFLFVLAAGAMISLIFDKLKERITIVKYL